MRVHYLQHVPFEGLGSMEPWLNENGFSITFTRLFESREFPDPEDIDMLIIVGGPMSVNDEDEYPWFIQEKKYIREVIEADKSVLGVCLGSQLIANALGESVYPNSVKEIGWFPVQGIESTESDLFQFPPSLNVFHWHGETFDLPVNATRLASSDACLNQSFQIGNNVIGLQFHLETTPDSAQALVSHCRDELVPSTFIQAETDILSATPDQYQTINNEMERILSYLLKNIEK